MNINEIVFNHRNAWNQATPSQLDTLRKYVNFPSDDDYLLLKQAAYEKSLQEARRLGYSPHPSETFLHDPIVLVEQAEGDDAGRALADKWGFHFMHADAMWECIDARRDGDAVIALIGDDRAPWYWIAIAWSPAEYVQKFQHGLSAVIVPPGELK